MTGLDEARPLRIVLQGAAELLNAGRERVVADRGSAPHRGEQILFRHRIAGASDERAEHARRLGREPDLLVPRPQPAGRGLKLKRSETDAFLHGCPLLTWSPGPAVPRSAASRRRPPTQDERPEPAASRRLRGWCES